MLGDELIDQEELKKKQEKLFEQQKKFRNLEADKKLFAEETINFIKKQKMSIDKLKKENEALKELIVTHPLSRLKSTTRRITSPSTVSPQKAWKIFSTKFLTRSNRKRKLRKISMSTLQTFRRKSFRKRRTASASTPVHKIWAVFKNKSRSLRIGSIKPIKSSTKL